MLGELLAAGYAAIVIWGLLIGLLPFVIGGSLWKIRKREVFILFVAFFMGVIVLKFAGEQKEVFGYIREPLLVTVRGEIKSIKEGATSSNVLVRKSVIGYNGKEYHTDGILLYLSNVSHLRVGDIVAVSGELSSFLLPRNEGEFNSYNYYKSTGVYYKVYVPSDGIAKVVANSKIPIAKWLDSARERLVTALFGYCYSYKDAGTMSAILLGEKEYLDDGLKENFRISGISHVLVVSGLHISLIGMGLFELLRRVVGYAPACVLASLIVIFYVWLTGFGPSGQRALIMFLVAMLGNIMGKSYDLCSGIGFAMLCMLIKTPYIFLGSGFVLSFMSVFAIGTIMPVMENICKWAFNKKMTGAVSGIAVFLMTLPVVVWNFYEYSLYGLILNIIIIPCMSVLVILGAGGLFAEMYLGVGEILLKGPVHILLLSFEKLSLFFNEMSVGRILFGKPSLVRILLVYSMLSLVLCIYFGIGQFLKRKRRLPAFLEHRKFKRTFALFFIPGICILEIFILLPGQKNTSEITMLDVGQGECIFMEFASGEKILLDAGSADVKNLYEKRVKNFLKAHAVNRLDCIIVSHADEDHISAVEEILKKDSGVDVSMLILPRVNGMDENIAGLSNLAEDKGCQVKMLGRGDSIRIGEAQFYCINPDFVGNYNEDDRNESSIVLHMAYGNFDMLFTGDIGEKTEKKIAGYLQSCEVLKVAHHGSKYSNSQLLLERVCPELAIISCSENNSYGHPHAEALKRLEAVGCKVMTTAESGAVKIRIGKKIEVYGFVK